MSTVPHHSTHASSLAALLANGRSRTDAATLLGITPSAVTQLAESPAVQQKIEQQLNRSSELDTKYDDIENQLLDQLKRTAAALMRPVEIARTLQIINGAKRRGVAATALEQPKQIVQLNLPPTIQNRFVVNSSNQVVSVGAQDLVTIQSNNVKKLLESHHAPPALPAIEEEDEFGFTSPATLPTGSEG